MPPDSDRHGQNDPILRDAWKTYADEWISWARTPGHDTYWRFHRDAFLPLVPPPGRLTLDVGCGEGRLGRDLARIGHRVVGVDASATMISAAVTHADAGGPAVVADAAALPMPGAVADCAVAFMSLQDIDAVEAALAEMARVLVSGGRLVMAITHPLNTAGRFLPGPVEAERPFVVEGSWFERRAIADTCVRDGHSMTFHSEHRPLHFYTDVLSSAGFVIERIREVGDSDPNNKWHRLPLFLHLRAVLCAPPPNALNRD
jgi:SAM-dependent methyltransferase